MKRDVTVCVFAKPPRAGEVKTRLSGALGRAGAATLAKGFFADTWASVSCRPWAHVLLATTDSEPPVLPGPTSTERWLQGSGDLGDRMESVLARALGLRLGDPVLALGCDSPDLPFDRLELAREALSSHDAVLGPAEDGGYYLLGLKRCPPGLLAGLPWSTAETCARTHERLVEAGLSVHRLEPWFDVDTPEDLSRLIVRLQQDVLRAPATWDALVALGVVGELAG